MATTTTKAVEAAAAPARFLREPLAFLDDLAARGDVVPFRMLRTKALFVNRPDAIRRVLMNTEGYVKEGPFWRAMRALLGESVTTTDGEVWAAQRRPVQRIFDAHSYDWSVPLIGDLTHRMLDRWEEEVRPSDAVDIGQQLRALNLRIGARIISGTDDATSGDFGRAFEVWHDAAAAFAKLPFPPLNWPTPRRRKVRAAERAMDASLFSMLVERLRQPAGGEPGVDVLSQLIASGDEAVTANPAVLRDNLMNLRLGTYENQSTALAWLWYWVTREPRVFERMAEEARSVLDGRQIVAEDFHRLTYTTAAVRETLRICPTIWVLMREAAEHDEIAGHRVTPGTLMLMSPYTIHRDARHWPDPLRFDPERWLGKRPEHGGGINYIPFGAGPHVCLAGNFAIQQMVVIAATIASRFDVTAATLRPAGLDPRISMRPDRPVTLHVSPHRND
ncbi:cytochrome P450 [Streptomyces sp. NPDC005805]|uniref:cytochrome P450 n=1 Tax=Streptomyces sp. NPDC005805 TaxID=3157068 RepID=UPI0033E415BE